MSTLLIVATVCMSAGGGLVGLWLNRRHRIELDDLDEAMAAEVDRRTRTYQRLSTRVKEHLAHVDRHVSAEVKERVEAYAELQHGVTRMIGGFEDREAKTRALLAAQRDRIERLEKVVREHTGPMDVPLVEPSTVTQEEAELVAPEGSGPLDDLTRIHVRLAGAVGADQVEIEHQTAWIERLTAQLGELRPVAQSLAETEEELISTRVRELALTQALEESDRGPTERDRRELQSTVDQLRQSLHDLEALWSDRESELEAEVERLQPFVEEVSELRVRLAEAEAELAEREMDDPQEELLRLREDYDAALTELEELERQLWALQHEGPKASGAALADLMQTGFGAGPEPDVPTLKALIRAAEESTDGEPREDAG